MGKYRFTGEGPMTFPTLSGLLPDQPSVTDEDGNETIPDRATLQPGQVIELSDDFPADELPNGLVPDGPSAPAPKKTGIPPESPPAVPPAGAPEPLEG